MKPDNLRKADGSETRRMGRAKRLVKRYRGEPTTN